MITKELPVNVVQAAERRIYETFQANKTVILSFSGGKDSICLSDVMVKTMQKYGISFSRLIVMFFDEEAIYPDVEKIVMEWRGKFLSLGARFYWFCLPIRHYNCCNQLANDESFICWEPGREAVWVREMPKFAIRNHALFKMGMSYQEFSKAILKKCAQVVGLRMNESIQRRSAIGKSTNKTNFVYPIYDWKDSDVWLYLYQNRLQIPVTYVYLFKCGVALNKLRISQFFSIDTIKTLPKVLEFYPDLYQRVLRREPNVDIVMLYWDTDMFRSNRQDKAAGLQAGKDYKNMFLEDFSKASQCPENYPGYDLAKRILPRTTSDTPQSAWEKMRQMLIAGDPKKRVYRTLVGAIKGKR